MIISDPYTKPVVNAVHDAFFGSRLPYISGAVSAVHRLIDARAEIAAVNEIMLAPPFCDCFLCIAWRRKIERQARR